MQFKFGSLLTVLLASQATASPVVARDTQSVAVTADDFVNFVNGITSRATGTSNIIKGITPANAKTQLQSAFNDIKGTVSTVESAKTQFGNAVGTKVTLPDQQKICNAFVGFFNAEQSIFSSLVAKRDIVKGVGLPADFGSGLRTISTAIEQIPAGLLGRIWPCGTAVGNSITSLSQTLKSAVAAYA